VETAFQSNSYISGNTDFWLRAFLEEAASKELNITTADAFYTAVDAYVAPIETGSRFARDLVWIDAEVPTAGLVTHQMRGISRELESSQDSVDSMKSIRRTVEPLCPEANISRCYAFSFAYIFFEQFAIIEYELFRNLLIALVIVWLVSLLLITNLLVSILVAACVTFTLIEVGGLMHVAGLTINGVTATFLILAIGLSVDYSVHIAHTFMIAPGETRDARVLYTFQYMGGSVLNGAMSTFVAVALLGLSDSFVFRSMFNLFLFSVLLGVYHGMVFLPVALSVIGPKAHYLEVGAGTGAGESGKPVMEMTSAKPNAEHTV